MNQIILKIIHSQSIKDALSVGRGLYRVASSLPPNQNYKSWHQPNQNSQHQPNHNSWHSLKPSQSSQNRQSSQFQSIKTTSSKIFNEDLQKIRNHPFHRPQKQQQVSKVPASQFSRFWQFAKLGKNLAESAAEVYVASKITGNDLSPIYEAAAEKISKALCKMRGAPLKIAQLLSIQQDDLIPAPIRKAFQKARQSSNVMPDEEVQMVMSKNLGEKWRQKFNSFQKAFAGASIGQVHKATLPNDKIVAVKVQYPGVKDSINSDIDNLAILMRIPGVFPKGIFIDRLIKSTKQELSQQCDYISEQNNQTLYNKCLNIAFKKNDEYKLFKVPNCFKELSSNQILVSEYLEGVSMGQLQQLSQQLRDEIGRRIMKLTFMQIFEMGIMQSDPNPANYSYNIQNNELNLLDFGATHIYNVNFLQNYYQIIRGSVLNDSKLIWQASKNTQFVTGEQNIIMKKSHIDSIMILGQPFRYKGFFDFGQQSITQKIYETIPLILKHRMKHPPQQIYSLHRKLSGSYLACIRLKAKVNCYQIFEEIKFKNIISQIK